MTQARLLCLLFAFAALGCVKEISFSPSGARPALPPNVAIYSASPDSVWNALLDSVRFQYLFSIEVEDSKQGYFATKWIPDSLNPQNARFRLSATVRAVPEGTAVTLYREQQVLSENAWKAVPSDYSLERRILEDLKNRLR
ncbi:MAG: hypothetical protein V1798_03080 [Pseudomonadota bacterium]